MIQLQQLHPVLTAGARGWNDWAAGIESKGCHANRGVSFSRGWEGNYIFAACVDCNSTIADAKPNSHGQRQEMTPLLAKKNSQLPESPMEVKRKWLANPS